MVLCIVKQRPQPSLLHDTQTLPDADSPIGNNTQTTINCKAKPFFLQNLRSTLVHHFSPRIFLTIKEIRNSWPQKIPRGKVHQTDKQTEIETLWVNWLLSDSSLESFLKTKLKLAPKFWNFGRYFFLLFHSSFVSQTLVVLFVFFSFNTN